MVERDELAAQFTRRNAAVVPGKVGVKGIGGHNQVQVFSVAPVLRPPARQLKPGVWENAAAFPFPVWLAAAIIGLRLTQFVLVTLLLCWWMGRQSRPVKHDNDA
jgi:hypothetical protein